MIKGIIFDCFGVLYVDWSTAYFNNFPKVRQKLHDLNVRADYGFIDKEAYLKEAAHLIGLPVREVTAGINREARLNKPIIGYVRQLKSHYKVSLLSNIGRGWISNFFTENQLHDLFDVVVLSNEEGIMKPDPEIFKRAADRLGLAPEECVMIDDREENCRGAEAAGMKSITYHTNEQLISELDAMLKTEKESL